MENIKNLGEVCFKGEILNLQNLSIEKLENKVQEIELEEKNIKTQILNILETL